MRKIFFGFWTIIFVAFAAVQYNDPDGWLWIITYLLTALLCFRALKKEGEKLSFIFIAVVFAMWAVNQFPPEWEGVTLNAIGMKSLNIELGRESLGLGLCSFILLIAGLWD